MDATTEPRQPVDTGQDGYPDPGGEPRGTVLIAAGRRGQATDAIWEALLRAARDVVVARTSPDVPAELAPQATVPPGDTSAGEAVATHVVAEAGRAAARMSGLIDRGHDRLVVFPLPPDDEAIGEPTWHASLAGAIAAVRARYPGARIHDLGRPVEPEMARALASFVAAPQMAPDALLAGAVVRGFDGDPATLARFLVVLRDALPPATTLALRGSAVVGHSFRNGTPFDAAGPGSSDLDVVVVGESAAELWVPEARLLGGINTLPLGDGTAWVAPELDGPRCAAQQIVGRPLSLQAMAGWFLELRTIVQAQPYVVLSGPA